MSNTTCRKRRLRRRDNTRATARAVVPLLCAADTPRRRYQYARHYFADIAPTRDEFVAMMRAAAPRVAM